MPAGKYANMRNLGYGYNRGILRKFFSSLDSIHVNSDYKFGGILVYLSARTNIFVIKG